MVSLFDGSKNLVCLDQNHCVNRANEGWERGGGIRVFETTQNKLLIWNHVQFLVARTLPAALYLGGIFLHINSLSFITRCAEDTIS